MTKPLMKIAQNLVILWDGRRISRDSNSVSLPFKRASVESAGFEDPAAMPLKGPLQTAVTVQGSGTQTEVDLVQEFSGDGRDVPFGVLLDSNALNLGSGVVSAIGDNALFMQARGFEFQRKMQRAALCEYTANFQASDRPWLGSVLYCGLGSAPIGASTVHSTPFQLGAVPGLVVGPPAVNGYQLAVALFVPDPPGISGTTPVMTCILESAALVGFSSPTTRLTFSNVGKDTNGEPTPGGQILYLDGDVSPVSDTWWRVTFTFTGTTPQFTPVVLAAIAQKFG